MKLNTVIFSAAIVLFGLSGIVSIETMISLRSVRSGYQLLEVENGIEIALQSAKYHIVQIQQFLTDASLTKEKDSIREAKENLDALDADIAKLVLLRPEKREVYQKVSSQAHEMSEVGLEMTTAYWKSGQAAGDAIMKRPGTGLDATSERLGKTLDEIAAGADKRQSDTFSNLGRILESFQARTLAISLLSILICGLSFYFIYRKTKPLAQTAADLATNSRTLRSAAQNLSASASGIAAASSQQAAATQQTAASLEEIRAMVGRTFEGAEGLGRSASDSNKSVSEGKVGLNELVDRLHTIESGSARMVSDVQAGNREVMGIVSIISEIGNKTKVINDIVFQTKLLSFNASVEAARAGEHGKGFAVVAEEVGNLAGMSGRAASEISSMLSDGIAKVESIIQENNRKVEGSIRSSREEISAGVESAKLVQATFDRIVDQVADVSRVGDEIKSALGEQKRGIEEIGKAIASLEQTTIANANASGEVAKVSQSTSQTVEQLDESVRAIQFAVSGAPVARAREESREDSDIAGEPSVIEMAPKKRSA
ncbi:MAG: hypothetical protein JST04_17805 [Bdellovibrionales bacterium]|nr:hypothetical protein [Bdellovibrionales bacterium]